MTAVSAHRAPPSSAAAPAARSGRLLMAAIWSLTLLMLAATGEIVLDGAVGHSPLIPKSPQIAGWLSGLGERLGFRVFLIALLVLVGAYAGIVALARRLSTRWAVGLIAALHALVLVGPILLSTDVFSYVAYARMGVLHGVDPYLHGPASIAGDPVFRYVGHDWKNVATAYGPLYTLLSYPLALLGLTGAVWGMKLLALLASAGTLALVWRCAALRGIQPRLALLAVGANPLYVIYGFGGAHNDLIMIFLAMAAVVLVLGAERRQALEDASLLEGRRPPAGASVARAARREALAGASVLGAAMVKATGIVLLPFILVSRRRPALLVGALGAAALGAAAAYVAFGVHGIDLIAALNRDAAFVSTDSFPTEIAHLVGKPGVFPIDHDLLKAGLVLIVAHLLWRTWRGYDWVAASGWTLLAISLTSTWLLAWYTLWSLPLAAVARDRRLLAATLAVQALFVVHQLSPLLAPVS